MDINGGERINSIPVNAKAIIASKDAPSLEHENIRVQKISEPSEHLNIYSSSIVEFMNRFENGVREFNDEINVVETSINLAKITTGIDDVKDRAISAFNG